ncbi:hypothetical protein [Kitasatospora sp. NPDC058190]|uniref:hypothetical protein n=1 Tax=Kitasatospora sp. NPDC058190 TaxID=3346371 RepID=UPI0036DE2C22
MAEDRPGAATMRREPLLFVLDEPTASLDAPSEQEIFQRQMARARELAARTGAITVIVSRQELLARQGCYAELYGIQATACAES